jgi:hypothetical protein
MTYRIINNEFYTVTADDNNGFLMIDHRKGKEIKFTSPTADGSLNMVLEYINENN